MKELTWEDRRKFTEAQVTERMKTMGIPTDYPSADSFLEAEIIAEVEKLGEYQLHEDVASLKQGEYSYTVLAAFANLAKALGSTVSTQYGEMKIRRDTTPAQRRQSAIANLQSRLSQERKDTAIRTLLDEQ